MILSILAALIGSGFGGGVHAGVTLAEQRLRSSEPTGQLTVSGSLVAALVAGIGCNALGRSLRTAFWFGAVLGAAGADRLDWWVLRRFGVNPERLIEQARAVAAQRAGQARDAVGTGD